MKKAIELLREEAEKRTVLAALYFQKKQYVASNTQSALYRGVIHAISILEKAESNTGT